MLDLSLQRERHRTLAPVEQVREAAVGDHDVGKGVRPRRDRCQRLPVRLVTDSQLQDADTMSDDLAYEVTKVLSERQSDLAAIHPEAKKLNLDTAVHGSPAPFHPGAIRYYQERGAWKP